eukprot:CAMPEP_0197841860 /NCGR_PEP_ID=MMETSP1437-20131217/46414_1 /TAXON_ID=49252 ORGANISM="Eucampia antarctica, Strain CCMP1452" /NCGR_SAMPLE_ID=MMETSP1437 /ASSEMBLY_ACC=CAM_ASM_001096 /LENGTH=836 /DNA_ID=CAMNT_0043451667 /DNA_START=66 /DNA_END=2575 /DNA_ORIENTATION=-
MTTTNGMMAADALQTVPLASVSVGRGYQTDYLPKKPPQAATDTATTTTPITFEDIGSYPGRTCVGNVGAPSKMCFSPNDESVVFLGTSSSALMNGSGKKKKDDNDNDGALLTTQKLWKMRIMGKNHNNDNDDDDEFDTDAKELAKPPRGVGEEDTLSEEEKLRRERTRQLHTGITSFEYSEEGTLLCPVGNDLFIIHKEEEKIDSNSNSNILTKLVDSSDLPGSVLDPHISSDGNLVVFCCEKELYACSTTAGSNNECKQITSDARGTSFTNGLADFVAMEEMERYRGFWIKIIIILSAGDPNPIVRLGLVNVKTTKTRWLDVSSPFGSDMYLARVQWGKGGSSQEGQSQHMLVQVMNREQTELVLLRFDIPNDDEETSTSTTTPTPMLVGKEILREKRSSSEWINLHDMLVPLSETVGGGFLWASERTGYNHLYRYDDEGNLLSTITSGDDWMVEETSASLIDEEANLVYFMGTRDGAKERHLYCTSLNGITNGSDNAGIRRVTPECGTHNVLAFDHKKRSFIDSWSSVTCPTRVAVRSLKDGSILRLLFDGSQDEKVRSLNLKAPEWFTIPAPALESDHDSDDDDDKVVNLHGAIYKPDESVYGPGPYPGIVSVYGGPHAQLVADTWGMTADLRAQRLRSQGYAVIKLDNRGSGRRGLPFETPIKYDMGNIEVLDQAAGVEHCIQQGIVKKSDTGGAVGIYGWSYGGYMSAMCLAKRPDIFKVGVAGAMVSSWDGYDTCYTERYMGTPQSNPTGYEKSSVMAHAENIMGSLLIVHGLIDENVHFRHSARFINSLIKARKHYELLLFPDERHVPRGLDDKVFMEERIASFFERCM